MRPAWKHNQCARPQSKAHSAEVVEWLARQHGLHCSGVCAERVPERPRQRVTSQQWDLPLDNQADPPGDSAPARQGICASRHQSWEHYCWRKLWRQVDRFRLCVQTLPGPGYRLSGYGPLHGARDSVWERILPREVRRVLDWSLTLFPLDWVISVEGGLSERRSLQRVYTRQD